MGRTGHWAGSGLVLIEKEAVGEYLQIRGLIELDPKSYLVTNSIVQTNIEHINEIENHSPWNSDFEEDL